MIEREGIVTLKFGRIKVSKDNFGARKRAKLNNSDHEKKRVKKQNIKKTIKKRDTWFNDFGILEIYDWRVADGFLKTMFWKQIPLKTHVWKYLQIKETNIKVEKKKQETSKKFKPMKRIIINIRILKIQTLETLTWKLQNSGGLERNWILLWTYYFLDPTQFQKSASWYWIR